MELSGVDTPTPVMYTGGMSASETLAPTVACEFRTAPPSVRHPKPCASTAKVEVRLTKGITVVWRAACPHHARLMGGSGHRLVRPFTNKETA